MILPGLLSRTKYRSHLFGSKLVTVAVKSVANFCKPLPIHIRNSLEIRSTGDFFIFLH